MSIKLLIFVALQFHTSCFWFVLWLDSCRTITKFSDKGSLSRISNLPTVLCQIDGSWWAGGYSSLTLKIWHMKYRFLLAKLKHFFWQKIIAWIQANLLENISKNQELKLFILCHFKNIKSIQNPHGTVSLISQKI